MRKAPLAWYNKEGAMQETEMREYLKRAILDMTDEQVEYVIRRMRELWREK